MVHWQGRCSILKKILGMLNGIFVKTLSYAPYTLIEEDFNIFGLVDRARRWDFSLMSVYFMSVDPAHGHDNAKAREDGVGEKTYQHAGKELGPRLERYHGLAHNY